MKELLAQYSISEIVIFIFLVFIAIKEAVSLFDWAKARLRKLYDKDYHAKEEKEEIEKEIEDLNKLYDVKDRFEKNFERIDQTFSVLGDQMAMLIESDKEDIKSFITREHHYFVYTQGWIDDYSMECLEKRFDIYQKEKGNTFVLGLMNELRALPKHPPIDVEHKYKNTAEYVKNANG